MDYESFFDEVRRSNIELRLYKSREIKPARLSNEALFHLPLLAITILLLAKDRRKPRVDEVGQLVGESFERTFKGFRGSSQHLGWSANLRVRTVRALTFLEIADLIVVGKTSDRIAISEKGKRVIECGLRQDSDLSIALRSLERNYRNIQVERQISLGL